MAVPPPLRDEFSAWQRHLNEAVARFPGFVSTEVIDPSSSGEDDFVIVYRFESAARLKSWLESSERAEHLARRPEGVTGAETTHIVLGDSEGEGSHPVTAVITVRVRAGSESRYREWQEKMTELMAQQRGHLGTTVQEPITGMQDEWVIMTRFDSDKHLLEWLQSKTRARMLDQVAPFVETSSIRRTRVSFDGWFQFKAGERPPRAWQQSALVLLVLFPVVMLEIIFLYPFLKWLRISAETFLLNAISVALTGFVLIPLAVRVFGWWIRPDVSRVRLWIGSLVILSLYAVSVLVFEALSTAVSIN